MILCGGRGQRLWPASRDARPKPFLPLVGEHTGLQEAALRARPLAGDGQVLVVGAAGHEPLIREQLAEAGVSATVLLEPAGRDTAAAIAAAAAWVEARHPEGVMVVLPADHHIPDGEGFRSAVQAALPAARNGAIVTLGLRARSASTAMGYIRPAPGPEAVKPVAAFVEKPTTAEAERLIACGALWNSGVFIATARTLMDETRRWAGEVAAAAEAALRAPELEGEVLWLGKAFNQAPRIAFDRAVMERTDRAAVLPVNFPWSDLGAWDAVLEASIRDDAGNSVAAGSRAEGGADVLVRAAPGVRVSVVGLSRVAVVAEPDAVLVCHLDHAQAVREAAVGAQRPFPDLKSAAAWYDGWLRTAALPLWATVGRDPANGGFREALTWTGAPHDPRRRARVQARQAFVFATAAADGLAGPWARTAREGFDWFLSNGRRPDGLLATTLDTTGAVTDREARLYEHAFVLLALAALHRLDPASGAESEALAILERLQAFRHGAGGFQENSDHPFQANAHMHLFEAALAWEAIGGGHRWAALGDELADLALSRFIDPATGALHEFFDADWRPMEGEADLIEPGHQFEWAWLLEPWGAARGDDRARAAARRLFIVGRTAFDPARSVVQNAIHKDFAIRDAGARLWPQTEHLKAALVLGEPAAALEAANGLAAYLDTPARGVWRERMREDGGFIDEPSPATSLYHLHLAIRELARFAGEAC
ncbi:AGE family epimerase/isomerase [Phenylobacterium kunshanense]|uniref:Mannose-1-phosphate guanylyltransferase n=1 Tax=Phenylobacterium kunshanense TaxID=1445034 RepID=A0A328BIV5_9CAUL|nr:AGE family epimerase/isomerase [Phenylobacterium kunshanense]RAK66569.1 mannose-1-phosphate guanylyltransferase [Phenylobacterium kunshanense]